MNYRTNRRPRRVVASSLSGGYTEKTLNQLEAMGYHMDDDSILGHQSLCLEHGLLLVGYAVNLEEELFLIAVDGNGHREVYSCSSGRLYIAD